MNIHSTYDTGVIGGGLAGLALAIQCSRAGMKTLLLEKESYPFHRVCGEYISLESWNFLQELGVPLSDMNLPLIQKVRISAPDGNLLEQTLPLGGFGISRFLLDSTLAGIAKKEGVTLMENTRVTDVTYNRDTFSIATKTQTFKCRSATGAFGKRSNLDVRWKRNFITDRPNKLNHFVAVKYHVKYPLNPEIISLHNFKNGYCGISAVEGGRSCLCYLTAAKNLSLYNGNISEMEKHVVRKNPHLEKILSEAEILYRAPLTISQISFNRKTQVENHLLMIGDAAGLIAPLCGNGMSMALHSSKLAFEEIADFLKEKSTRFEMESQYTQQWEKHFGGRLQAGRAIQRFFGSNWKSGMLIRILKPFPSLVKFLIRQTHGHPF